MLHRRDSHPPPAQQSDRLAGAIATAMEEQQATVNSTPFTRNGQSTATAAE
jgi:hypothetical protein